VIAHNGCIYATNAYNIPNRYIKRKRLFLSITCQVTALKKMGCAWVQVANATLNFGIICQKKGVAYGSLLSVKH